MVAAIGLFNIIGSLSVGWLQNKYPKRYILSIIYFARALSIVAFISFPITTFSAIVFGAATGLTWLSTVPPTSALVALMFGTRWFATLYGFAFVSHRSAVSSASGSAASCSSNWVPTRRSGGSR